MRELKECKNCIKVDEITSVFKTIAPEMVKVLEDRYNMLRIISYLEPIGRRSLSNKLDITERIIRKEANVLKENNLVEFSLEGMSLTLTGENTLRMLNIFFKDLKGIKSLEEKVAEKLNIKKVIIAASSDDDKLLTLKELGKVGSDYLNQILLKESVIGVTGGSSVASVIDVFKKDKLDFSKCIVIPARGGLGNKAEFQANTLAEKLANKLGSSYKTLYTPDVLSKSTIDLLMSEPEIKETIDTLEKIDLLIFGIGNAETMSKRRSLNSEKIGIILNKGAVSEAFGYYFDKNGEIVHEMSTIGIKLSTFKKLGNLIAVAGGEEKVASIISICKLNSNLVLITDENVARKIINDN
ncbi:sugar-binding transcriptional regulator [Helicovermis profundi]|uniref:Sugar-binding domain-containing protein n=1 Tax=Helicovermis profundi TaxID=3065157 RepID=A0AAU9EUJ2_9FIRM|nr:sugar-binding domain-containing protein [Clostridia bacterium S502]